MQALYVETAINGALDEVWRCTQDPGEHARWDLRFSSITPTGTDPSGNQVFSYALRLPGRTLRGRGVSVGERWRTDGTCTSALRWSSDDRLSPLGSGAGYWRYEPGPDGVRFLTGYDYRPGWGVLGRVLDPLLVRPFVGWLTARSFDALRIWIEHGVPPEQAHRRGCWTSGFARRPGLRQPPGSVPGDCLSPSSGRSQLRRQRRPCRLRRPFPRRCRRRPPDPASGRPPRTLDRLPAP
ncbi:MAG: SRPBCC family protein [Actinomycetota bacterium]|nr:SRPBCC family protein [Actinomycetota bacterium]